MRRAAWRMDGMSDDAWVQGGATGGSRRRARAALLAAGLVALVQATSAQAGLGSRMAGVEADGAHLHARRRSTASSSGAVHELTTAGGVVKEYAAADGAVFAVSWRGAGRPDLKQLLGEHFTAFQADQSRSRRRTRRPVLSRRSELVVYSAGHPGAFWGVAYLPDRLPAGFNPQDVR